MNDEHNFCATCGQRLIEVDTNVFDVTTGKRIKWKECPSGICGHTGIIHVFIPKKQSWWSRFLEGHKQQCSKCGMSQGITDFF